MMHFLAVLYFVAAFIISGSIGTLTQVAYGSITAGLFIMLFVLVVSRHMTKK